LDVFQPPVTHMALFNAKPPVTRESAVSEHEAIKELDERFLVLGEENQMFLFPFRRTPNSHPGFP